LRLPARTVPVEAHLHAAELVGEDLLAGGADHGRGLQADHRGPLGGQGWAIGKGSGQALEGVAVFFTGLFAGAEAALDAGLVLDARDQVSAAGIDVADEFERLAWGQATAVAGALNGDAAGRLFLHA